MSISNVNIWPDDSFVSVVTDFDKCESVADKIRFMISLDTMFPSQGIFKPHIRTINKKKYTFGLVLTTHLEVLTACRIYVKIYKAMKVENAFQLIMNSINLPDIDNDWQIAAIEERIKEIHIQVKKGEGSNQIMTGFHRSTNDMQLDFQVEQLRYFAHGYNCEKAIKELDFLVSPIGENKTFNPYCGINSVSLKYTADGALSFLLERRLNQQMKKLQNNGSPSATYSIINNLLPVYPHKTIPNKTNGLRSHSSFEDYLSDEGKSIFYLLQKEFSGEKTKRIVYLLLALEGLNLLASGFDIFSNKTALHDSLTTDFGDIGTRQALSKSINTLKKNASLHQEKEISQTKIFIQNLFGCN